MAVMILDNGTEVLTKGTDPAHLDTDIRGHVRASFRADLNDEGEDLFYVVELPYRHHFFDPHKQIYVRHIIVHHSNLRLY